MASLAEPHHERSRSVRTGASLSNAAASTPEISSEQSWAPHLVLPGPSTSAHLGPPIPEHDGIQWSGRGERDANPQHASVWPRYPFCS
jgi:hypothetical protein